MKIQRKTKRGWRYVAGYREDHIAGRGLLCSYTPDPQKAMRFESLGFAEYVASAFARTLETKFTP